MSRCGDVYENRATGEYVVVLRGSEDRGDGPILAHLLARPGAAVAGAHRHPSLEERFRVVSGQLTASIDGREQRLGVGEEVLVPAGVVHDWWNASTTEDAHVLVAITPVGDADPERFELMIGQIFGLGNDGKADAKGRPRALQGVLIAEEFADVIRFAKPPWIVQRAAIALLAPIARRRGLRAIEPRYSAPHRRTEPDPRALAAAGLAES